MHLSFKVNLAEIIIPVALSSWNSQHGKFQASVGLSKDEEAHLVPVLWLIISLNTQVSTVICRTMACNVNDLHHSHIVLL